MTVEHSALTSIHPGAHTDSSTPSSQNANDLWVQRSGSPPYQLYLRKADNSAYEAVGLGPVNSVEVTVADIKVSGITGAATAARLVGANSSGAPASGTFIAGDLAVDLTGKLWVCATGGTPGTWVQVGGGGGAVLQVLAPVTQTSDNTSLTATTFTTYPNLPSYSITIGAGTRAKVRVWGGMSAAGATRAGVSFRAKINSLTALMGTSVVPGNAYGSFYQEGVITGLSSGTYSVLLDYKMADANGLEIRPSAASGLESLSISVDELV